MRNIEILLLVIVIAEAMGLTARGQSPEAIWPQRPMMSLPPEAQHWFRNPDGSCVQCSGGMVGAQRGDYAQATLLFDTEYGPAERGGSGPDRVARYCRQRGIEVYNVTGRSFEDTQPWLDYAARTGRFAAVGCFSRHFQTLYGRDFERDLYYVQNNWDGTFDRPYVYSAAEFKRHHEASGPWVVIPVGPPMAIKPMYRKWW